MYVTYYTVNVACIENASGSYVVNYGFINALRGICIYMYAIDLYRENVKFQLV